MKILIVGTGGGGSTDLSVVSAFRQLGHEVLFFDMRDHFRLGFLNRVINRLRKTPHYWGVEKINDAVLKSAYQFLPDLILFIKPVYFFPETITKLKLISKVFSWYPDYILFPKTSSYLFYKTIPLYDCHFSFNFANAEELKKCGAKLSLFLPCAADLDFHRPVSMSAEEKKYFGSNIAFVGTYAQEKRLEYLERLCHDGYDIKIWGNGWNRCPKNMCLVGSGKIQFRQVLGDEMSKVFNASKIVLAFVRQHNSETLACRTYEIPACGGFLLHERTAKIGEVFREGVEAEFFSSYEEMQKKIDIYLADDELRHKVADAGMEKVVSGGHLFKDRVAVIVKVFNALLGIQ